MTTDYHRNLTTVNQVSIGYHSCPCVTYHIRNGLHEGLMVAGCLLHITGQVHSKRMRSFEVQQAISQLLGIVPLLWLHLRSKYGSQGSGFTCVTTCITCGVTCTHTYCYLFVPKPLCCGCTYAQNMGLRA